MNRIIEGFGKDWPFYWITIMMLCLATYVACMFLEPKSVTITAKQWQCTASDTFGIEARCIQYSRVASFKERKD